jgi:hypothetical protein
MYVGAVVGGDGALLGQIILGPLDGARVGLGVSFLQDVKLERSAE